MLLGAEDALKFRNHPVHHGRIVFFLILRSKNAEASAIFARGGVQKEIFKYPPHLIAVHLLLLQKLESVGQAVQRIIY